MLTNYGLHAFLTALGHPFSCRLWTKGTRIEQVFPCDAGYPKLRDKDEANCNGGDNVMTWRYTIPRGTTWGPTPATEAELLDGEHRIDRLPIPDLFTSANHPTVLYLNMTIQKR